MKNKLIQMQNEIDIEAGPKLVWQVLIEVEKYKSWNPFLVEAQGQVRVGSSLELTMSPPGLRQRRRKVMVTSLESYREFSWMGTALHSVIFCGHNRFTLTPLAEHQTRLIQEEIFSGLLAPFYATRLDQNLAEGFKKMLIALKSKVEGHITDSSPIVS